jgi:hypothetical protein
MNRRASGAARFVSELKRRSVFKVAAVYAATAWGASMGAADLLPAFGAPDWSVRAFVVLAVLGLPIAVVIAWAYEITPHGIVRDEPDEPEAATPKPQGAPRTTMLLGPAGSVHVSWQDAAGVHERSFTSDFRIGRDEGCELHLDDPLISRRHVEVSHGAGQQQRYPPRPAPDRPCAASAGQRGEAVRHWPATARRGADRLPRADYHWPESGPVAVTPLVHGSGLARAIQAMRLNRWSGTGSGVDTPWNSTLARRSVRGRFLF